MSRKVVSDVIVQCDDVLNATGGCRWTNMSRKVVSDVVVVQCDYVHRWESLDKHEQESCL